MKRRLENFSVPGLLFILCLLAFGLQAFWLGYYLDDWVVLYHVYRGGYQRLAEYSFLVNRPLGAWPWWLSFTLLGYAPVHWQLWGLFWRWLTGVLWWLSLKELWPERRLSAALSAVLFVIYPIFVQQASALTFSDHWICFALYIASILSTLLALKHKRLFLPLTALALLFSATELFTIEYFVGLEFIRPLLIWIQPGKEHSGEKRLRHTVLHTLPYALLNGGFLIWRFALMPTPGSDRNIPSLLFDLFKDPLHTLPGFSIRIVRDLIEALLGTWYKTYQPASIGAGPISNLASWAVAILAFLLAASLFFIVLRKEKEPEEERKAGWWRLGFAWIVLIAGFLPAWSINQHLVSAGNYSDRFGLAAMPGVSLLIIVLTGRLLQRKPQLILICLLVGLGTGYHFRLGNTFRWSWEKQTRLAYQLTWRLPGLQPQTAVFGDGVLSTGSWVDIAWLNFLYGTENTEGKEAYWYFDATRIPENSFPKARQPLDESRFEYLAFQGNSSDSIAIQFKTIENQCLWLIDAGDRDNPYLNPALRPATSLSNPARIAAISGNTRDFQEVFGPEPPHDWCFYFEKADLAAQQEEWDTVKLLWEQAEARQLNPSAPIEYIPFIYGIANSGDVQSAIDISKRAKSIDYPMRQAVCETWEKILADPPEGAGPNTIKQQLADELDCD